MNIQSIMIKILLLFILIFSSNELNAQQSFFFDAVAFRHNKDIGRVDILVAVPYKDLDFKKKSDLYFAKYELSIEIIDEKNKTVADTLIEKIVTTDSFEKSLGATADIQFSRLSFMLPEGSYNSKVRFYDKNSKTEILKSRSTSIINFKEFPFSMGGMLLLSAIEERNKKYIITPYLSDNISPLKDGFFVFFEAYNEDKREEVDLVYEIIDKEGNKIKQSNRIRRKLKDTKDQLFLRIRMPKDFTFGTYTVLVYALRPSSKNGFASEDILAITQRAIRAEMSLMKQLITNIDDAIRQLRYVANNDEKSFIEDAKNDAEKEFRFYQFWKTKDPNPDTERNEAMEEFYARVKLANKRFKSYAEGWLTDMGMAFIIYGPPSSVERYRGYTSQETYEKWYYLNQRELVFFDDSGFGYFRLYSPLVIADKYEYKQ